MSMTQMMLLVMMLNLIPRGKNQPSGKNPSDPSDVNDSIDLFGNNVERDHNLKISSTHVTNNIDNLGNNSRKEKFMDPLQKQLKKHHW
jgi:hypothetical protein